MILAAMCLMISNGNVIVLRMKVLCSGDEIDVMVSVTVLRLLMMDVRIHARGSDQEGRAWPQLVHCAPYPSTCP
jgi:hypothetical protein